MFAIRKMQQKCKHRVLKTVTKTAVFFIVLNTKHQLQIFASTDKNKYAICSRFVAGEISSNKDEKIASYKSAQMILRSEAVFDLFYIRKTPEKSRVLARHRGSNL